MKTGRTFAHVLMRVCIVFFCTYPFLIFSQNQTHFVGKERLSGIATYAAGIKEFTIPFRTSIPLDQTTFDVIQTADWVLTGENINQNGAGSLTLSQYVFEIPGEYTVEIIPPASTPPSSNICGEIAIPTLFVVHVLPCKWTINTNSITYSHPIEAGIEMTGESLDVDVVLESYQNQSQNFDWIVRASGVECSLGGQLSSPVILQPGTTRVQFLLQGKVTHPQTYIGIEFIDTITGFSQIYNPQNAIF